MSDSRDDHESALAAIQEPGILVLGQTIAWNRYTLILAPFLTRALEV